jgi:hypothetical protein
MDYNSGSGGGNRGCFNCKSQLAVVVSTSAFPHPVASLRPFSKASQPTYPTPSYSFPTLSYTLPALQKPFRWVGKTQGSLWTRRFKRFLSLGSLAARG